MKKKIMIGIIILLIGIILLANGIISTIQANKSTTKPNTSETQEPKEKNKYQNAEVIVFDFQEQETEQEIKVSLDIYNNSYLTLENTALFLDFYEDDKIIYTSQFDIDDLEPNQEIKVTNKSIVFLYDKITDLKFRYANEEVPYVSKDEYLKEYGKLDANKIVEEE